MFGYRQGPSTAVLGAGGIGGGLSSTASSPQAGWIRIKRSHVKSHQSGQRGLQKRKVFRDVVDGRRWMSCDEFI